MTKYRIVFESRTAWDRDNGRRPDKTVEAKYPQFSDGWITFKDDDNKIVYQIKESEVESIEVIK
ncbi:MAG: hypothetical protein ABI067_17625 [Leifsonia sp.]